MKIREWDLEMMEMADMQENAPDSAEHGKGHKKAQEICIQPFLSRARFFEIDKSRSAANVECR